MKSYRTGQTVRYRGAWGADPITEATIVGYGRKNGRRVYSLNDGHWCYADQIVGFATAPLSMAAYARRAVQS